MPKLRRTALLLVATALTASVVGAAAPAQARPDTSWGYVVVHSPGD